MKLLVKLHAVKKMEILTDLAKISQKNYEIYYSENNDVAEVFCYNDMVANYELEIKNVSKFYVCTDFRNENCVVLTLEFSDGQKGEVNKIDVVESL